MAANLLSIEHLTKVFTERELFSDTDFYIQEGEKVALIGVNGTGKSTLLKIVAGLEEMDEGKISMRRNLSIRYLPQNPEFSPEDSILTAILKDNEGKQHIYNLETEAKKLLNQLGIRDYGQPVGELSGGQRKRVALCSTLLSSADLLVLDEPTNHLDGSMSEWLEQYLKSFRGTILMITHDRYFLDSICDRILELDGGKLYSYQSNYAGYLELKAERLDIAKAQERSRQNLLRKELAWIRRGAKARSTKQKGRIQRYEKLSAMHGPTEEEELKLSSISSRLGKSTIELDKLSKSYGDRKLIENFSYNFLRNDRVGIIGPNGAGKSTLLKLIQGWERPDSGEIRIGQTVRIGYFSQENEELDGSQRVIDSIRDIAEYVQTKDGLVSASVMLDRFLFPPSQQFMRVEKLSGGEKRRLYLLKVLMSSPNVLILDEPTNDLDIRTMTILEDYLDGFAGIVLVVSHDRYFLDRCVNRIFAFEGNGKIAQYEGGFTDYQVEFLRRHPEYEGDRIFLFAGALAATGGSGMDASAGKSAANLSAGAKEGGKNPYSAQKNPEILQQDAETLQRSSTASGNAGDSRGSHQLKMSYREMQDWKNIESEIESLEQELSDCETEYLKYANDFGRLNEVMKRKEALDRKLTERMERWEYLSELNERIEAERSK